MGKVYRWIKVAESVNELAFGSANLTELTAGDQRICIGNIMRSCWPLRPDAPHAGGVLAEGFIDALGNVVCPLHRYRFCLKNGRNISGEGHHLKHWPVEVKKEGVFIGLEGNGF